MKILAYLRTLLPPRAVCCVLLAVLTLGLPLGLHAQTTIAPGGADPTFSNTNNTEGSVIQVAAQSNGKIVALGAFPGHTTPTSFVRLNADGMEDATFARQALSIPGGNATAFAVQPDGKIVYVGAGASDGNTTASVGRLTAGGAADPTFVSGTVPAGNISSFYAVALEAGGKIYVGGDFTSYNGQPAPGIVRLNPDGTLDPTFVLPTYDQTGYAFTRVLAVAVGANGRVVIAGNLLYNGDDGQQSIAGAVTLNNDGSTIPFGSPVLLDKLTAAYQVPLVIVNGGDVVVGGDFTTANGSASPFLARFDQFGSLNPNFHPALDGRVLGIAELGGNYGVLLVGGLFTNVSGAVRPKVALLDSGSGSGQPNAFNAGTGPGGGYVQTVALQADGNLLVGGSFGGFGTATRDNLVRLITDFEVQRTNINPPGTSDLWLAGTAPTTTGSNGQDTLLNAIPLQASALDVVGGQKLIIVGQTGFDGGVVNDPANPVSVGPDGGPFLGAAFAIHPAENGIAGLTAPYNALIGVFLDDTAPSAADAPPAALDFSGAGVPDGVNFTTIAPALRQPFFIGDGSAQDGASQRFVVPAGATRLYLGSLDQSDNENNTGSYLAQVFVDISDTGGGSPTITSSLSATAAVGQPFTYQIVASGLTATSFVASGLPDGLTVDPNTGLISGTPTGAANTYPVMLIASDATGTAATATLSLVLQDATNATGPVLVVTDTTISSTSNGTGTSVIPGDKITYGFTVRNTSNFDAANVVVVADLEGVRFKTVSDGGVIDDSTATWNLGTVAAHSSRTLTATTKLPATVAPNGEDFLLAISKITTTTANATTLAKPVYLTTKVLPPYQFNVSYNTNVAPGDTLRLTLTARNLSKSAVSGLSASAVLPAGVTFLSLTDESGASLGVKPNKSGNLTFPLPALAAGGSAMVTLSLQINFDTVPGSTLTVTGLQAMLGALSFSQPDISVMLAGTPPANPPSLAVNKYPTDGDSLGLTFTFNPGAALALQAALLNRIQIFSNGDLDPTAVAKLGLSLNPTVGVNADAEDPNAPPFSVGVASTKVPAPYITYAINCLNNGTGDVSGVTVTDPIPDGFIYDPNAAQAAADPLTPPYAFLNGKAITSGNVQLINNGRTVQFKVGKLKAGAQALILYQLQLQPSVAVGSVLTGTVPTLTAKELAGSVTDNFNLQYLVTGPAHAVTEVTTPAGNFGTLATFDVFYHNDGGKKSNDLKVLVRQPANALPYSARFLDHNRNVVDPGSGQFIEDALDANGNKVFHLGKVKSKGFGYVRITYQPVAGTSPSAVHPVATISPDSFGAVTNAVRHGGPVARDAFQPRATGATGSVSGSSAGSFIPDDPRYARFALYQHAPFVVRAGETYQITVSAMNISSVPSSLAGLYLTIPDGVDYVSLAGVNNGVPVGSNGLIGNVASIVFSNIDPHTAVGAVLTLRAHASNAGQTIVNVGYDLAPPPPAVGTFVSVKANNTQTSVLKPGDLLPVMATQIVGNTVSSYGLSAATVANTAARLAVQPSLGTSTLVNAAGVSFKGGGLLVPLGALNGVPQVVVAGSPSLVAQGGGNLIAQGGGNLIAQGGGNLLSLGGQSALSILNGLISQDGGGVVAAGQANILNGGGLNLISQDGGGLISQDGGGLVVRDISQVVSNDGGSLVAGLSNSPSLISQDGGGLISQDGGGLIAQGGGNLIAQGGGNIFAAGGGNLVAQGGGNFVSHARPGSPMTRAAHPRALASGQPAQGSPTNSVVIHATDDGLVIVGGGSIGN